MKSLLLAAFAEPRAKTSASPSSNALINVHALRAGGFLCHVERTS